MIDFSKKRIVKISVLDTSIFCGSYSLVREVSLDKSLVPKRWIFCREVITSKLKGARRLLFRHRKRHGKNVAMFIAKVEEKLNINPRTKFGPTQRNNIMWLRVSPWWTSSSMKISLFTALLRAGQNYSLATDNFEKALYSIVYTRKTKAAIERFFNGYTRYTGNIRGWHTQFTKVLTEEHLCRLLVAPKKCKESPI